MNNNILVEILKHLAGRHNQKTHGRSHLANSSNPNELEAITGWPAYTWQSLIDKYAQGTDSHYPAYQDVIDWVHAGGDKTFAADLLKEVADSAMVYNSTKRNGEKYDQTNPDDAREFVLDHPGVSISTLRNGKWAAGVPHKYNLYAKMAYRGGVAASGRALPDNPQVISHINRDKDLEDAFGVQTAAYVYLNGVKPEDLWDPEFIDPDLIEPIHIEDLGFSQLTPELQDEIDSATGLSKKVYDLAGPAMATIEAYNEDTNKVDMEKAWQFQEGFHDMVRSARVLYRGTDDKELESLLKYGKMVSQAAAGIRDRNDFESDDYLEDGWIRADPMISMTLDPAHAESFGNMVIAVDAKKALEQGAFPRNYTGRFARADWEGSVGEAEVEVPELDLSSIKYILFNPKHTTMSIPEPDMNEGRYDNWLEPDSIYKYDLQIYNKYIESQTQILKKLQSIGIPVYYK